MTEATKFLNEKEETYFKSDREPDMFVTVPNIEIAKWMDEYVDIRIKELGYKK